jgi:hypothetical protein
VTPFPRKPKGGTLVSAFDYITAREFRQSLEADYTELQKSADSKSWKSVHVLAGSIVEALLVDYIASTKNASRPARDPLKLDLAEAIAICEKENVLSERSAALCSVIRSYRNLIHPGRMVRLQENPPTEASAKVALALVEMINQELANVLRKKMGLTAEQIVSKVLRDNNSLNILPHLIPEISDTQKERLLLELIPAEQEAAQAPDTFWTADDMPRLEKAYRLILESATSELRTKVAAQFANIIRDADGASVSRHGRAFFQATDLEYVPKQHRSLVIAHLLSTVSNYHTMETLAQLRGISNFLTTADVSKWIDPFMQTLAAINVKDFIKERTRNHLIIATADLSEELDAAIDKRLNEWIKRYDALKAQDKADSLRELAQEINDMRLPF